MPFTFRPLRRGSQKRAKTPVCVCLVLTLCPALFAQAGGYLGTTVAGGGAVLGDNGPAISAQLSDPGALALDSAGNLYIADSDNSRIRKVSNGVIATVAGDGTFGFSGDYGPATSAQLYCPTGVVVDSAGNLYIADIFNSRIRKVSNGVITTVAGSGSSFGDDGPATGAQLYRPHGVAVDSAGNLYIADIDNNRIRKVSNGLITTVAGGGSSLGDYGPATSAQLNGPYGVAVDLAGNLYVADASNHRLRKVTNGVITTVAGNGTQGFSGDGGPATSAQLNQPTGAAADASGNLLIADSANKRVRRLVASSASGVGCVYSTDQSAQIFGAAGGSSSVACLRARPVAPG
jgi:sugar lactone lactonase YvrE